MNRNLFFIFFFSTILISLIQDSDGNQVWICPACGRVDDGTPMIGCDGCDAWYHWLVLNESIKLYQKTKSIISVGFVLVFKCRQMQTRIGTVVYV